MPNVCDSGRVVIQKNGAAILFFYFQPDFDFILDNTHGGRGRACFGDVFLLSQPGHIGAFFSSLYTRKARPQSLHSYSLPGIFSHLPGIVIIIPHYFLLNRIFRHNVQDSARQCHKSQATGYKQEDGKNRACLSQRSRSALRKDQEIFLFSMDSERS